MAKKKDLPAMPFYVGDWLKAPEVRALPPDYRGLWFDCLCYMWESTERGYLVKPNGKPYSHDEIIRIVGLDKENSNLWLNHIIENEVCSVRESDGAIYSRRMVKDEYIRDVKRENGKQGGNPKLGVDYNKSGYVYAMIRDSDSHIKIGISTDPNKRIYKVRQQFKDDFIKMEGTLFVNNMGDAEKKLHSLFANKKNGEWFNLSTKEREKLNFLLKGNLYEKENSPYANPQANSGLITENENENEKTSAQYGFVSSMRSVIIT